MATSSSAFPELPLSGGPVTVSRALEDWAWLGRLCARLVADPGLAEDARQEAWLAATRKRGGEPDRHSLLLAAKRFVWRSRRGSQRRAAREAEAAMPEALPSVDELLSRSEQQRRVWDELMQLDEPFRTALLLRYQEGLDSREIAAKLEVPPDTVRWRLRRGVERLREKLQADRGRGGLAAVALGVPGAGAGAAGATKVGLSTPFLFPTTTVMLKLAGSLATLLLIVFSVRGLLNMTAPGLGAATEPTEPGVVDPEMTALADAPESVLATLPEKATEEGRHSLEADSGSAPNRGSSPKTMLVGRAQNSDGQSLQQAEVRVHSRSDGLDVTVYTGQAGRFELEVPYHLNRTYYVEVSASDLLMIGRATVGQHEGAVVPIPRSVGRVTDLGDITLADARVLIGQVVDSSGVGIEGVKIHAASTPRVEARPDGTFRLPHVGALAESVTFRASGFEDHRLKIDAPLGSVHNVGKVRLTATAPALRRANSGRQICTFRIVDAATGKGILEYRGELSKVPDFSQGKLQFTQPQDSDALHMKVHPTCDYKVHAMPSEDVVVIASPGYKTQEVDIESVAATGVQVVKLKRAPRVHGRVIQQGLPVPFAEVAFLLGNHRLISDGSVGEEDRPKRPRGRFVMPVHPTSGSLPSAMGAANSGWMPGIRRVVYADEEGHFTLPLPKEKEGVVAASHLKHGSRLLLFEREARGDTDLGDLELLPRKTLRGVLRFSCGTKAAGYEVVLLNSVGESAFTSDDGRFEFANLHQGDVTLKVRVGDDPVLRSGHKVQSFHAILGADDSGEVALQIESLPSALVEVIATVNGQPASGYKLSMAPESASATVPVALDQAGRGTLRVPAGEPISVRLTRKKVALSLPEKPVFEVGNRTLELHLSHGSVLVVLPPALELPGNVYARLRVEGPSGEHVSIHGTLRTREDGREEALFEGVPVGSISAELEVNRTRRQLGQAAILERSFAAQIQEGEPFEIEL